MVEAANQIRIEPEIMKRICLMAYRESLGADEYDSLVAKDGIERVERNAMGYLKLVGDIVSAIDFLGWIDHEKLAETNSAAQGTRPLTNNQIDTIDKLPMTIDDWNRNVHHITRREMENAGYVTIADGQVTATEATLQRRATSKTTDVLITDQQHAALEKLATSRDCLEDMNGRTRNWMTENEWISRDGRILPKGQEICSMRNIPITAPQDARNHQASGEFKLTETQLAILTGITSWKSAHGKTRSTLVRDGFCDEKGNLTEKGQCARNSHEASNTQ